MKYLTALTPHIAFKTILELFRCLRLWGEVSKNRNGSVFGCLCVEMILTGALWNAQRGSAFSICASRGNQLTGLPVFSLNYAMQVMTGRGLVVQNGFETLRLHPCIIH